MEPVCRPAPHVLPQGLCPYLPVNTLFFSSSAEEGMRGRRGPPLHPPSPNSPPTSLEFLPRISSVTFFVPSWRPCAPWLLSFLRLLCFDSALLLSLCWGVGVFLTVWMLLLGTEDCFPSLQGVCVCSLLGMRACESV